MSKDYHIQPECILYVCCGSKCKKRGGKLIYKQLKGAVKENHLKKQMKVIKTGCTDNCKHGPVITVMPRNEWHFHVDESKASAIFESTLRKKDLNVSDPD